MFPYSLFLIALLTIVSAQLWDTAYITIDNNHYCEVEANLIQPPFFECQENDFTPQFNSTHASFILGNLKCHGMIENIKTLARYCGNRIDGGGGYNAMATFPTYGTNQKDKKPLKAEDVFH